MSSRLRKKEGGHRIFFFRFLSSSNIAALTPLLDDVREVRYDTWPSAVQFVDVSFAAPLVHMLTRRSRSEAVARNIICCLLKNKGTLEAAQKIAAYESPRTAKLYDKADDQLTLDEIEKIKV